MSHDRLTFNISVMPRAFSIAPDSPESPNMSPRDLGEWAQVMTVAATVLRDLHPAGWVLTFGAGEEEATFFRGKDRAWEDYLGLAADSAEMFTTSFRAIKAVMPDAAVVGFGNLKPDTAWMHAVRGATQGAADDVVYQEVARLRKPFDPPLDGGHFQYYNFEGRGLRSWGGPSGALSWVTDLRHILAANGLSAESFRAHIQAYYGAYASNDFDDSLIDAVERPAFQLDTHHRLAANTLSQIIVFATAGRDMIARSHFYLWGGWVSDWAPGYDPNQCGGTFSQFGAIMENGAVYPEDPARPFIAATRTCPRAIYHVMKMVGELTDGEIVRSAGGRAEGPVGTLAARKPQGELVVLVSHDFGEALGRLRVHASGLVPGVHYEPFVEHVEVAADSCAELAGERLAPLSTSAAGALELAVDARSRTVVRITLRPSAARRGGRDAQSI
ncbi:MAG: hypothetical protein HYV63_28610 [Candidatus Schekmanbacteria bacterium]|nr:hypothetical protein [Candidatus Schekmanbacteria bacterium]